MSDALRAAVYMAEMPLSKARMDGHKGSGWVVPLRDYARSHRRDAMEAIDCGLYMGETRDALKLVRQHLALADYAELRANEIEAEQARKETP